MSELRRRGLEALRPYIASGRRVVAVCHGVIIHALTGCAQTGNCEVREFVLGAFGGQPDPAAGRGS
jgi:hypothetical protein